jgi:hypothetical protein
MDQSVPADGASDTVRPQIRVLCIFNADIFLLSLSGGSLLMEFKAFFSPQKERPV